MVAAIAATATTPSLLSPWSTGWAEVGGSVIYPRGANRLRFDHARHADQACATCHAGVARSSVASERHLPREAACRGCHPQVVRKDDSPAERSGDGRCAYCHRGYAGRGVPARVDYPQARLRFSHRLHQVRGVGCATCHRFDRAKPRPLPRMSDCLGCHQQRKASTRCVSCHLSGSDGRLVTRFGQQQLRPSGVLKGDAHGPQFVRQHAQVARGNRSYCESCHQPKSCLRCHAGSLKPLRIHAGDYQTHHALDARRNQPRCSSCHRSQTFCLGCHQRLGVSSSSVMGGFRPSTGLRFHPEGFSAVKAGPQHHKYSARRNIRTCSSCHEEKSCVRCHGTRQIGSGGYSPHPPGFGRSLKCRALAARNQRSCLKCHAGGDARLRCF